MIKEILIDGKKIVYRITGTGKPVILIHGFGEEAEVWNNQVDFLQDKFQLIVPDLPGSGQSEMIDDMSMEGMAEVIHFIIHEENIESCPVIGHSMGGYILLALMESYWNHVSAFGLFHSSAFADSEEKKATRRKGIELIQQNGAFEFLKTATPNLFSPITKDEKPELIVEQVARLHNFSPLTLVSYYEAMMQRPDRTEILRKATVPVLFIMGKYDAAVPVEDGLKQCHLPEKSYIHILRHSGHMGMLEEPDKSNLALENFLQEL
jgi:pimeloyl-ACP methyl ester carboxylesterase